jgi:predicted amidohydrolase
VQEAQDLGASVIFHAISCSGETDPAKREILMDWHAAHHRTWAMRIGITVVAANQPKALGSLVHCGIVGPDGNYVVRVPNHGEQFFVGDISL